MGKRRDFADIAAFVLTQAGFGKPGLTGARHWGEVDGFVVGQYFPAAVWVSEPRLLHEVDLPAEHLLQVPVHVDPIEEVPFRGWSQGDQDVDIAVGTEVFANDGSEESEFDDLPSLAEGLDRFRIYGYPDRHPSVSGCPRLLLRIIPTLTHVPEVKRFEVRRANSEGSTRSVGSLNSVGSAGFVRVLGANSWLSRPTTLRLCESACRACLPSGRGAVSQCRHP